MQQGMNDKPVIAIVGGGFCGALTLAQLCRQSSIPLSIRLINKENPAGRGIAFSSYNASHLLNVAAAKMSAFPDDPGHFVKWVCDKPAYQQFHLENLGELFLPRVIYGHYLEELLEYQLKNLPAWIDVSIVSDEVIDITCTDKGNEVFLKNGSPFLADKVILATGNFVPANPSIVNKSFYEKGKAYFPDPWKENAVSDAAGCKHILIIGTGLTMVDNVLSLIEKGFEGKITAVSTKGFFPLSHKKTAPYTAMLPEMNASFPLVRLYHIFKKHIREVLAGGVTGEVVVDAVRPLTQEIWINLSLKEKKSFMQHLRHLWGVARHRLPADIHQRMTELMKQGKLEIVAGRLYDMEQVNGSLIKAGIRLRRSGELLHLEADRVINCTGPQMDIRKIDNDLIRNLISRGLLCPDEMYLGMQAFPDGTLVNAEAVPSNVLFTLGSNLKGILWESTAVPELRVQAKNLARMIISQLSDVPQERIVRSA